MHSVLGISQALGRLFSFFRLPRFLAESQQPIFCDCETNECTKINGQTPNDRHFDQTENYQFQHDSEFPRRSTRKCSSWRLLFRYSFFFVPGSKRKPTKFSGLVASFAVSGWRVNGIRNKYYVLFDLRIRLTRDDHDHCVHDDGSSSGAHAHTRTFIIWVEKWYFPTQSVYR